jgi:hypothetical protein
LVKVDAFDAERAQAGFARRLQMRGSAVARYILGMRTQYMPALGRDNDAGAITIPLSQSLSDEALSLSGPRRTGRIYIGDIDDADPSVQRCVDDAHDFGGRMLARRRKHLYAQPDRPDGSPS